MKGYSKVDRFQVVSTRVSQNRYLNSTKAWTVQVVIEWRLGAHASMSGAPPWLAHVGNRIVAGGQNPDGSSAVGRNTKERKREKGARDFWGFYTQIYMWLTLYGSTQYPNFSLKSPKFKKFQSSPWNFKNLGPKTKSIPLKSNSNLLNIQKKIRVFTDRVVEEFSRIVEAL